MKFIVLGKKSNKYKVEETIIHVNIYEAFLFEFLRKTLIFLNINIFLVLKNLLKFYLLLFNNILKMKIYYIIQFIVKFIFFFPKFKLGVNFSQCLTNEMEVNGFFLVLLDSDNSADSEHFKEHVKSLNGRVIQKYNLFNAFYIELDRKLIYDIKDLQYVSEVEEESVFTIM